MQIHICDRCKRPIRGAAVPVYTVDVTSDSGAAEKFELCQPCSTGLDAWFKDPGVSPDETRKAFAKLRQDLDQ